MKGALSFLLTPLLPPFSFPLFFLSPRTSSLVYLLPSGNVFLENYMWNYPIINVQALSSPLTLEFSMACPYDRRMMARVLLKREFLLYHRSPMSPWANSLLSVIPQFSLLENRRSGQNYLLRSLRHSHEMIPIHLLNKNIDTYTSPLRSRRPSPFSKTTLSSNVECCAFCKII